MVALAALLPLAACNASSEEEPNTEEAGGGTLRVALSEIGSEKFDPRMDIGGAQLVWTEIYEQLIGIDSEGNPDDSGLAESWEIGEDGRSVAFKLREGVKWHDGSDFTSADVVFSVDYYRQEGTLSPAGGFATSTIASAEANGDFDVTIHFNESGALALAELNPAESFFYIVPKDYVEANTPDVLSAKPVGTGPWKFAGQEFGQYVDLEANEDYWNSEKAPSFDKARIQAVPEGTTRAALIRSGDVDIAQIDASSVETVEAVENLGIRTIGRGASTIGAFLRSYDPASLSNELDFRKAVNLAIDREAILQAKFPEGYAELLPGSGLFATGAQGSDTSLTPYPYDPDEAKQLLEGIYNGEEITMFSYAVGGYDTEQPSINELLQGYWEAVGLNVKLVPIDYATFRPRVDTQDFPKNSMGTFAPAPRPSMASQLRIYLNSHEDGGTIWIYQDPEQARAWQDQIAEITDPDELEQLLGEINRQMYEEYFSVPLWELNIPYAVDTNTVDSSWVPGDLRRVNIQLNLAKPA